MTLEIFKITEVDNFIINYRTILFFGKRTKDKETKMFLVFSARKSHVHEFPLVLPREMKKEKVDKLRFHVR